MISFFKIKGALQCCGVVTILIVCFWVYFEVITLLINTIDDGFE